MIEYATFQNVQWRIVHRREPRVVNASPLRRLVKRVFVTLALAIVVGVLRLSCLGQVLPLRMGDLDELLGDVIQTDQQQTSDRVMKDEYGFGK